MGVVGIAWALDAVASAPSYTGRVLRQTHSPMLAGATTARPFGGSSGVRPGTSVTTVTSTSTTWTAQTFAGVIDLEASALSGAYEFAFNLVTSGSVTASNASNPRIDILSVRIDDPAEGDGTSVPAVTMVYTAGVAAGSPVAPATPARSFIIAQFNFTAGSGTTPSVTWVAPYTVAAGGVQPVASSTFYPASPYYGQIVFDAALGYPLFWNGSAWTKLVPAGGLVPIIPTSVAAGSGTATVGTNGVITITAVGTSLRANGVYLAAYDYVEAVLDVTAAVANTITAQLSLSGTPVTTAYDTQSTYSDASSSIGANATVNGSAWLITPAARTRSLVRIKVSGAALAVATTGEVQATTTNATANLQQYTAAIFHRTATACTDLNVLLSGSTITGTLRFYGYNNN